MRQRCGEQTGTELRIWIVNTWADKTTTMLRATIFRGKRTVGFPFEPSAERPAALMLLLLLTVLMKRMMIQDEIIIDEAHRFRLAWLY